MTREEAVRAYFQSWLKQDDSALREIFAADAVYTESYGPQYTGLDQILRWFQDWNKRGTVLRWDVNGLTVQDDRLAVEWYFECAYEGNVDGFDGVSLIRFDEEGKIAELREFQSKHEHEYPYGKNG